MSSFAINSELHELHCLFTACNQPCSLGLYCACINLWLCKLHTCFDIIIFHLQINRQTLIILNKEHLCIKNNLHDHRMSFIQRFHM